MLWLLSVPAVPATTWIVDQDGGGDAVTVAEGIALLSDGDTLHINAGVYEEYDLQIDAVGVAIEGDGPGNTIVGWDAGAWLDATVFRMDEGSVRDLTLTGLRGGCAIAGGYGSEFGAGYELRNLVIEDFHCAVQLTNQPQVLIDGVTFRNDDYGVWVYSKADYLTVVNSLFEGTEKPFYTYETSAAPRGLYWTIANNTIVGAEIGIEMHVGSSNLYGCPYVAIVNNVVAASDIGISVQGYTGVCWSGFINNNLISSDVPEPEYYWQSGIVATDTTIGDPDFVDFSDDDDWTNDNLRIGFASAAIDIGTEEFSRYDATALDADGVGRPLDGDLDGTALPDAGAYEANPDADADGYPTAEAGGDDCDDRDSSIHPGVEDVCGDGMDRDCSGADEPCPDTGDSGEPADTGDSSIVADTADSDAGVDSAAKSPTPPNDCGCTSSRESAAPALVALLLLWRRRV